MGTTTKNGRTRNRRGIGIGAPPKTYPLIATPFAISRATTNSFEFRLLFAYPDQWPYNGFAGDGQVKVFSVSTGLVYDATVTYNSVENKFNVDIGAAIVSDTVYQWLPWQEGVRGFNGEWVGSWASVIGPEP